MHQYTIEEARARLKRREISAVELTQAYYDRIDAVEDKVGAYTHLTREIALQQAQSADERIASGEDSPLLGIPIAIKDLICMKDARVTCSSRMLENFVSPYDATVVGKLKEAGAVILGKTNMDEFAMGSSTENSALQKTKNPWDLQRVPGGSSGGSAAAVAAQECVASLGSDTGGSIRQPASFCGVTGVKPTYGRVSRFGLVAFASSLDQIGPMTKTVADSATLLNVISGHDPLDSTSANVAVPDFRQSLQQDVRGMKIGLPEEYFTKGIDPEVEAPVRAAIQNLKDLGMEPVSVSLPHMQYAVACYYILACAEASANLSRYDGVKYGYRSEKSDTLLEMYTNTREEGFGEEVKRRILLGTFVLSSGYYDAYYLKGQKVRTLIKQDFETAFQKCDVIAAPVCPTPAFRLNEKSSDPLQMYLSDIYTISANLAGIPGLSVPCGFTPNGLPVGLQLLGEHFDESSILQVGNQFQINSDHHLKTPTL
ncbi:MAG: Asp-tRNA(Asn)/Glu-tRNA(Gln) amidotransferase subunit GatA [Candidatus Nitrohelix vancouverensis]|uniref:Glutamyl-tRNA(Gln) amidotransferase subunit A n=1 Tax=Candidatus Nitrohelix vancouverensis TaxID=2705534 RepID=A0A7T0C4Z4_9BACT|nr:MAG: Asp-tRNA(Asn)/Glu-tRNA(Gln) amidotransferase subunit GatA [Candidatus Nitrohelix vancouverensis]